MTNRRYNEARQVSAGQSCPQCGSDNIDQTGKFDLTLIDPTEARHDFECFDCECLFQIVYHPVAVAVVETAD